MIAFSERPELISEEGLQPWSVRELWLMAHPQIGHPVDITDTFSRKVKALTAMGRASAYVLLGMPFVMGCSPSRTFTVTFNGDFVSHPLVEKGGDSG